ncbi:hypothetical protein ACFOWE_21295 [Planomonospora corallina]|uniref:Uncharacterized protein n=1 Tax=Planomonospora corallina TaxID=1806052 RepID=A0ABV8I9L3_9ACTN
MRRVPALLVWAMVTVVAALGVLPGLGSAGSGNDRWPLAHRAASLEFHATVVPLGERDAWAFGTRRFGYWQLGPTSYRWDGERWRDGGLPAGIGDSLVSAGGSSPENVWAVTSGDDSDVVTLRWDGREWTVVERIPALSAWQLTVVDDDDVWLFGMESWHHTRAGWARAEVPMTVTHASARSATDIWAVGSAGQDSDRPLIGHYDGRSWETTPLGDVLPVEPSAHYALNGVTADASGVRITASVSRDTTQTTTPLLLSRTGGRWQAEEVTAGTGTWSENVGPVPDGRGGHWFLAFTDDNAYASVLAHRSATGAWTVSPVAAAPDGAHLSTLAAFPGTTRFLSTGRVGDARGVFFHQVGP